MNTTETLDKEIRESIEKNLPSFVSEVLSARLTEGGQAILDVARLKEQAVADTQRIAQLTSEIAKHVGKEADIARRETAVAAREATLTLNEAKAEAKIEYAGKAKDDIYNLVALVFRNPVIRSESNKPLIVPPSKDAYGNNQGGYITNNHESTTQTTE